MADTLKDDMARKRSFPTGPTSAQTPTTVVDTPYKGGVQPPPPNPQVQTAQQYAINPYGTGGPAQAQAVNVLLDQYGNPTSKIVVPQPVASPALPPLGPGSRPFTGTGQPSVPTVPPLPNLVKNQAAVTSALQKLAQADVLLQKAAQLGMQMDGVIRQVAELRQLLQNAQQQLM